MNIHPIVILGPTASGKSQLGIQLAKRFDGEVVSLDAYQIYRGMDIATAKVKDFEGVTHHLVDIVDITHAMSVNEFQSRARFAISDIQKRNRLPILVGGSALYIQAVLYDFQFQPTDRAVRKKITELSNQIGSEELHKRLSAIDPNAAALIAKADTRRIIRALEVNELTGENYNAKISGIEPYLQHTKVGLNVPAQSLHQRIKVRVRLMLEQGLVDEVQRLNDEGLFETVTASKAIGYEDALRLARGEISEEEAIESISHKTMMFVRKQMKWFKRDASINWFDAEDVDLFSQVESLLNSVLRD